MHAKAVDWEVTPVGDMREGYSHISIQRDENIIICREIGQPDKKVSLAVNGGRKCQMR